MHEVADDLDAAVERVVDELLSAPARRGARREGARARAALGRRRPRERIAAHRTSDEGQEGLRAFLEKRTASWREP